MLLIWLIPFPCACLAAEPVLPFSLMDSWVSWLYKTVDGSYNTGGYLSMLLAPVPDLQLQASVIVVAVAVGLLTLLCYKFIRNFRGGVNEVREFVGVGSGRPRFRKRDKVMFYGYKMLRKVRGMSGQQKAGERQRLRKRQIFLRFAKKLLRLKKENQPTQFQQKEPPPAFLEADWPESMEQVLPPEVFYMLQSIRIFGHFDKPMFLELCRHLESRFIAANQYLFKIGDEDDSIFVVQNGKLNIFLTEPDGSELPLKCVCTGESVTSFLSFVDVLAGHSSIYKTVSARAEVDTTVLRLPLAAFQGIFDRYPESLVRVIQIICVRLHRVSFTALYQYLGLTSQLVNPAPPRFKEGHRHSIYPNEARGAPPPEKIPGDDDASHQESHPPATKEKHTVGTDAEKETSSDNSVRGSLPIPIPGMGQSAPPSPSPAPGGAGTTTLGMSSSAPSALGAPRYRKRKSIMEMSTDESPSPRATDVDYMKIAIEGFMVNLGIEDPNLLEGRIDIRELTTGTYLISQHEMQDTSLVYTLTGSLLVSQKLVDREEEAVLFTAYHGEIVGGLAVVSGEPSFFTIRARQNSRVAIITKENFYEIMRSQPRIVLHTAVAIVRRLSSFVRQIDFALDWKYIESGRALYRQGDPSDCIYIVLSGRLRSVITMSDGKKELVGEYGKGDLVGVVELLTNTPRSTTLIAVRDTELAVMPEGLLNTIKVKFPEVLTRLIHLLGHRILSWQRGSLVEKLDSRPSASNFSTVAILAVNEDVPLTPFVMELYHCLSAIGPTLRLTSELIRRQLGNSVLDRSNEFRLSSWLGHQEDHHRMVIYQCDNEPSQWNLWCMRQADAVLILALADQEPTVGRIEQQLESVTVRTQKELVLIHKENATAPHNTVDWLNIRSWCSSHHHIRGTKRMFMKKSPSRMMEMYAKVLNTDPSPFSDFARLARFLTGTSIGLVLGGGGARGSSHVGMIRAFQEAGIPIDMVGGTSIGSFMAALWSMERDVTTFTQRAREWARKMNQLWRQVWDTTFPVTAWFTGAQFNKLIYDVLGDTQIEDLWLPYFAITTDISNSTMRVHTHGSLWRYIRASMSLSGYLPPLCDPNDGHLLLDGGYVNNLPADVMRNMGAATIFAVDVGSQEERDLTNYGDHLSGWWLLLNRFNPWGQNLKVPSLADIQSRLAYVSCVRQLEEVKRSNYCTYIRPPIDRFGTLQFKSFDEIKDVGYEHGKGLLEQMKRDGTLPAVAVKSSPKNLSMKKLNTVAPSSFTDLAEMVCRIKQPKRSAPVTDYSSEEEDEYDEIEEEEGMDKDDAKHDESQESRKKVTQEVPMRH